MCDPIVQQLAGVYRELVDRKQFSEVAQTELSSASASGRVARLLIFQCDTDSLQLLSFLRKWWVVDDRGLHADAKWPLSQAIVEHEDWQSDFPFIKFATDGQRVRFGMRFGDHWYVEKEGPLGIHGQFDPHQLVEKCRYAD